MSIKDVHTAMPPARNFHPEFGLLCPSAALRRRVRRVAKLVLAGTAVAAGAALALSSVLVAPGEMARQEPAAATVAQVPPTQGASPTAQAMPTTVAPPIAPSLPRAATAAGPAALAHAQASCDDPSVSFLSPQCQSGKKSHATHSARGGSRVATVPLGRAEAPPAAEPNKATAPGSTPAAVAAASIEAAASSPS
ncbi:MAG TPA: hypothetical protein VIY51_12385, partial [Xanthobacteraceae bacterium]